MNIWKCSSCHLVFASLPRYAEMFVPLPPCQDAQPGAAVAQSHLLMAYCVHVFFQNETTPNHKGQESKGP